MKKYKKYNDYELLYLLDWHSEEALYILMEKYDNLINAKLLKFNICSNAYYNYLKNRKADYHRRSFWLHVCLCFQLRCAVAGNYGKCP